MRRAVILACGISWLTMGGCLAGVPADVAPAADNSPLPVIAGPAVSAPVADEPLAVAPEDAAPASPDVSPAPDAASAAPPPTGAAARTSTEAALAPAAPDASAPATGSAATGIAPGQPAATGAPAGGVAKSASSAPLLIELNALAQVDKACRLSFRIQDGLPATIKDMALELVLLDWNGMTERFILVRAGEIPAGRMRVRQFDIANMDCDNLGGVLLNDIDDCSGDGLTPGACLDRVAVSSLVSAKFEY